MSLTDLLQNIFYGLTILGIPFGIYIYFRRPQESAYTNEKLFAQSLKTLESEVINLRDNHLHTIETKVDALVAEISGLKIQMARLTTIIDERIPKK